LGGLYNLLSVENTFFDWAITSWVGLFCSQQFCICSCIFQTQSIYTLLMYVLSSSVLFLWHECSCVLKTFSVSKKSSVFQALYEQVLQSTAIWNDLSQNGLPFFKDLYDAFQQTLMIHFSFEAESSSYHQLLVVIVVVVVHEETWVKKVMTSRLFQPHCMASCLNLPHMISEGWSFGSWYKKPCVLSEDS
jgi:hypothetical protein